jgi:sugar phosphate isomerase/epimerase
MPRFMVTRTLPPLTSEQLESVGKNVVGACDKLGMQWIRSHVTADGQHSFCEFEAPSAEACREHAKLAELPVDDVIQIGIELGPGQFK